MIGRDYKVERATVTLSIVMLIFLIISILSFFDIFNISEYFKPEYCKFPSQFECEGLEISPNSIRFTLTNNGQDLEDLRISTASTLCESINFPSFSNEGKIEVDIPCVKTAPREKPYRDIIRFNYRTTTKLSRIEKEGKIKSSVKPPE